MALAAACATLFAGLGRASPDDEPPIEAPDSPYAAAFSPDGKWLAIASSKDKKGRVTLWDALDERPVRECEGELTDVRNLAFSPDGKLLFGAGFFDPKIHVWRVDDGKATASFDTKPGHIIGFALAGTADRFVHANAGELNGEGNSELYLRDAGTGAVLRTFCEDAPDRALKLHGVAISPNGKEIAAACTGDNFRGVAFFDAQFGGELRRLEYDKGFPLEVAYSPDGKLLACAGGDATPINPRAKSLSGDFRIYDLATSKIILQSSESDSDYFRTLAFSADGKRVYATASSPPQSKVMRGKLMPMHCAQVHCWESPDWKKAWTAVGEMGRPHLLAVHPDGGRVVVSEFDNLRRVNTDTGKFERTLILGPFAEARRK
jgi:WD40 repeat protein